MWQIVALALTYLQFAICHLLNWWAGKPACRQGRDLPPSLAGFARCVGSPRSLPLKIFAFPRYSLGAHSLQILPQWKRLLSLALLGTVFQKVKNWWAGKDLAPSTRADYIGSGCCGSATRPINICSSSSHILCSLQILSGAKKWAGKDLNLRRLCRQIYSLLPLTTRPPARILLIARGK